MLLYLPMHTNLVGHSMHWQIRMCAAADPYWYQGIVQHEHMGYVFLRALEGICTRSPILNQLGGMLLYSSNVPFLAPTDLGGKSYMYLPQMSYHPPVLCGQTTQLWSTEKQLALCIHFFFT